MKHQGSEDLRLLVGFSEGSGSNVVARMISPTLSEVLNQTVTVERVEGENGARCVERLAHAAPDGRTLAIAAQTQIIGTLLHKRRYDPLVDFVPVAVFAKWPMVFAVSNTLGITSVSEFITLAQSQPRQLTYASSAIGGAPHLAGVLFSVMAGIDMQLRVYSETNTLYVDLVQGRIAATFNNIVSALPLARAGKVRMLAVTGRARNPMAPEVPTLDEAALAGYEVVNWLGIVAPAATPAAIITRINAAMARTVETRNVRDTLLAHGMEPVVAAPEAFATHIRAEIERWGKFINANRAAFAEEKLFNIRRRRQQ
ncbi:MAG: tripartite tricarboxylate transporter substrate binding protein [Betaproteobacteria bacterium]|nr:tripartite tricarboxylate transporter substrate binding protein [Betaproteobacteria bacterium]